MIKSRMSNIFLRQLLGTKKYIWLYAKRLHSNDLKTEGWRVLRFNTNQVKESTSEYCISLIAKNINRLGGLKEGQCVARKINLKNPDYVQLSLFDNNG
ncbi:MAG: hypothetical protein D3920_05725 [Candidatus Electrothrix sp. AW2]|nr:hypothetical protein [Candidatus Electrothrix gigas]